MSSAISKLSHQVMEAHAESRGPDEDPKEILHVLYAAGLLGKAIEEKGGEGLTNDARAARFLGALLSKGRGEMVSSSNLRSLMLVEGEAIPSSAISMRTIATIDRINALLQDLIVRRGQRRGTHYGLNPERTESLSLTGGEVAEVLKGLKERYADWESRLPEEITIAGTYPVKVMGILSRLDEFLEGMTPIEAVQKVEAVPLVSESPSRGRAAKPPRRVGRRGRGEESERLRLARETFEDEEEDDEDVEEETTAPESPRPRRALEPAPRLASAPVEINGRPRFTVSEIGPRLLRGVEMVVIDVGELRESGFSGLDQLTRDHRERSLRGEEPQVVVRLDTNRVIMVARKFLQAVEPKN